MYVVAFHGAMVKSSTQKANFAQSMSTPLFRSSVHLCHAYVPDIEYQ